MSLAIALIVAACGGGTTNETSSAPADTPAAETPTPTESVTGTSDAGESSDESMGSDEPADTSSPAAEPSFDGPPAPDFEFALADGTNFVLSAEQKPVYMVFWAEW